MDNGYVWTRQHNESSQAYDAFKLYLRQGKNRSTLKVAAELGKADSLIRRWSSTYDWTARSVAYDSYLSTRDTEDVVQTMAESRDKNMALVDKLRSHLSTRLDTFIETKQDPTIRWTQALAAMAKLEQNSLAMREDHKTTERIEKIEMLVERALELGEGAGA